MRSLAFLPRVANVGDSVYLGKGGVSFSVGGSGSSRPCMELVNALAVLEDLGVGVVGSVGETGEDDPLPPATAMDSFCKCDCC